MAEKDWPKYASSLLNVMRKKNNVAAANAAGSKISLEYSDDSSSEDIMDALRILNLPLNSDAARLIIDLRALFLQEQERADAAEKAAAELSAQLSKKSSENSSLLVSLKVEQDKVLNFSKRDDDQRMVIADLKKALLSSSPPPSPTSITATDTLFVDDSTNVEVIAETKPQEFNSLFISSSVKSLKDSLMEKETQLQALQSNFNAMKIDMKTKDEEILALKRSIHDVTSSLSSTREKLQESTEKLEATDEKASFFHHQVTEYKSRLENWLTDANEERTKLQSALENAKKSSEQKGETIIVLRKSLVDSLALLKPLRSQIACMEQDIRGLKRRLGSSQLYAYHIIDSLEEIKCKHAELQTKYDSKVAELDLLSSNSLPLLPKLHEEVKQGPQFTPAKQKDRMPLSDRNMFLKDDSTGGGSEVDKFVLQEELKKKSEELDAAIFSQNQLNASLLEAQKMVNEFKEQLATTEAEKHDIQNLLEKLQRNPRTRSEMEILQEMEEFQLAKTALEVEKKKITEDWPSLIQLELLETEIARLKDEKCALLATIEEMKAGVSKALVSQGNDEVRARMTKLTREIESLSRNLESMKLDHKMILSEKNRDIRELTTERDRIKQALKEVEIMHSKLKPYWEAPSSKEIEAAADRYEQKIRKLETLIAENEKKLCQADAKVQVEMASKNALHDELHKMESELNCVDSIKATLQELQNESAELTREIDVLREEQGMMISEHEKDLQDIQETRHYLAESIDALKELYSYVPREISFVNHTEGNEENVMVTEGATSDGQEIHVPLSDAELAEGFAALEARLFELGCLYQITKNKLRSEVRLRKALEETVQQLTNEVQEMKEEIDSLSKALHFSENELMRTKRIAKDAVVQVDDLTRVLNKRRGELRRREEFRKAVFP
jgi:predicted  nucleic acid-binding Zn-ribbon protein